ncbi:MAG: DNA primase [Elusimicrobia bacterium ADurb.Bin231]|nr:MAG: DNA primase [Elusimicrobia bacterium ADurb.Bin231]
MAISQTTIQNILNSIDIVDVVGDYVNLAKAGLNYRARCPFHNEKTPSFYVNQDKQIFHCFGCNAGGNAITFVMRIEGINYPEAVKKLAGKAGIEIKDGFSGQDGRIAEEKETIYNVLEDACLFFQKYLEKNRRCMEWIEKRGIERDTVKRFRLGYAPSDGSALVNAALKKKYSADILKKSGLASSGLKDFFYNRIIFPIFDVTGRVLAFGGRTLNDVVMPKYLNSPETLVYSKSRVLYGLNFAGRSIKEKNRCVLVEGYVDVVVSHQFGITETVAGLGTAFTQQQASVLKRYSDNIILAYDSDAAGRTSALRTADILLANDFQVKIAVLPDKSDTDEVLLDSGAKGLENIYKKSKTYVDFLVDENSKQFDIKTISGKKRIAAAALLTIAQIPNMVVKSEYLKILSERLKVKSEFLYLEMSKIKQNRFRGHDRVAVSSPQSTTMAMNILLSILVKDLKMTDYFTDICDEVFTTGAAQKIYGVLRTLQKEGKTSISPAELSLLVGTAHNITDIFMNDFKISDPQSYVKEYRNSVLLKINKKKLHGLAATPDEFSSMAKKIKGSHK